MDLLLYGGRSDTDLGELKAFLRGHLLDNVMPFWERHGFSPQRPGMDTCLGDDGSLLGEDRYLWSQLRAIWTFAALYNRIEPRPAWRSTTCRVLFAMMEGSWWSCGCRDTIRAEPPPTPGLRSGPRNWVASSSRPSDENRSTRQHKDDADDGLCH